MSRRVALREIAHARAGDKGDTSNVSVFAFDAAHYPALKAQLTAKRVKVAFGDIVKGEVRRFELETLAGLNFVMERALEGGVNESLNLDSHGKSWSFLMLGIEIEVEDG
jgi:hypothetical protein